MKTAVLISGQMRTFAKCYPTQRWQIFRHYGPEIHFFVACCNDQQAPSAELLRHDFGNVHIQTLNDPDDLPDIPIQKGSFAPYANAATHYKLMLQHWGNKKVWDFFAAESKPESFDIIIRIRPDLWIHRFEPWDLIDPGDCVLPWWGKFGGVNDRLAVLGSQAAAIYFNLYDAIPLLLETGCPFHPETLLATALDRNDIEIRNELMTEFSTERMDGSRRWAEIVMSDIAELIAIRI